MYLTRKDGGRGILLLKDIYKERNETGSCLLHGLLRKQLDQCCIEKIEHQGGELYSRRKNEENTGRWSRDPI